MLLLYREDRGRHRETFSNQERTMEAKAYLQQIKDRRERARMLLEEVEQLRADAESVSINLDGMPRNGNGSSFEQAAIKLAEYETRLTEEMSGLWSDIMKAHNLIGQVSSPQRQMILTKRYLYNQRWETIAYEMHMSWQHCFRVHGHALAEMDKILKNNNM